VPECAPGGQAVDGLDGGILTTYPADHAPRGARRMQAYAVALEPHHPWIIKKTILAAMHFLPHRKTFMDSLAAGSPAGELVPKLRDFLQLVERVRQELWRYYKEKGLTDLP
jgi:hypothetical protein